MKVRNFKKGKFYHVKWLDHATCYDAWTHIDHMKLKDDLPCETVGFFVSETKTSIYLALSRYSNDETFCALMQIIKSTILSSKEIK